MTFDVCNMIGKSNGHLLDINCGIADNVIANSTKMGMSAKESAYFVIKNPHLYAVSVGPQVDDAHTIDETLHVSTVKPLVKTIVNTLQHIGEITE